MLATLGALIWALQANPLAAPFVDRTQRDLALALERAVNRTATADWLTEILSDAVESQDAERAAMLIALTDELGRDVDTRAARALVEAQTGVLAGLADCGRCMADTANCASLSHLTFCAVPFELSPVGDLNALRRAAVAAAMDEEVDEIDAGLAIVGLAATAAVIASGGTSVAVKAGAGLLRTARRMGSVTPTLARSMHIPIRWNRMGDFLVGSARLDDVADMAALARLGSLATDLDRVRAATSTGEALRLTRFVDTPEDAARLARVAEAAGPRTTRSFAVLGKGRVFRATVRLSRAALGALALIWLTAAQLAAILGTRLGALALRGATRLL